MVIKLLISNVLVLSSAFIALVGGTGNSWIKAVKKQNYQLNINDGFTHPSKDKTNCMMQCILTETYTCIGSYFNGTSSTCYHIQTTKVIRVEEGPESDEIALVARGNGTAVLVYIDRDLNTATQDCLNFGGHLMTMSERSAFADNGLQLCKCGWVADGVQRRLGSCASGCSQYSERRFYCTLTS